MRYELQSALLDEFSNWLFSLPSPSIFEQAKEILAANNIAQTAEISKPAENQAAQAKGRYVCVGHEKERKRVRLGIVDSRKWVGKQAIRMGMDPVKEVKKLGKV